MSDRGLFHCGCFPGVNLRDTSLKLTPWQLYVTLRVGLWQFSFETAKPHKAWGRGGKQGQQATRATWR